MTEKRMNSSPLIEIIDRKTQRMESVTNVYDEIKCTTTSLFDLPEIQLTKEEETLFQFLLSVVQQYQCNVILRVAGGWVRDKLLGRESKDIDIVIDTMTGKEFAELINKYEKEHGKKTHSIGIIKANPGQSKHLETATMQLEPIGWIDFVNLRAETYTEEHRIPEITVGTLEQDAERRDFTMNALFYNLSTRCVEDFTQKGISDLYNGLVRTPLDPLITFLDDPLRVLRAVRFAARYKFTLHTALRNSISLEEVKIALMKKVSRERVGIELENMLTHPCAHPLEAFKLLYELELCRCVFFPPIEHHEIEYIVSPSDVNIKEPVASHDDKRWEDGYKYAIEMHQYIIQETMTLHINESEKTVNYDAIKLRMLAAFLLPWANYSILVKKRTVKFPVVMIREGLKLKTQDAEQIGNVLLKYYATFQSLARDTEGFNRVKIGSCIREIGPLWQLCLQIARIKDMVDLGISGAKMTSMDQQYTQLLEYIQLEKLETTYEIKPLVNGHELVNVFHMKKGPGLKTLLDRVIEWQMEFPNKSKDECHEFIHTILQQEK